MKPQSPPAHLRRYQGAELNVYPALHHQNALAHSTAPVHRVNRQTRTRKRPNYRRPVALRPVNRPNRPVRYPDIVPNYRVRPNSRIRPPTHITRRSSRRSLRDLHEHRRDNHRTIKNQKTVAYPTTVQPNISPSHVLLAQSSYLTNPCCPKFHVACPLNCG